MKKMSDPRAKNLCYGVNKFHIKCQKLLKVHFAVWTKKRIFFLLQHLFNILLEILVYAVKKEKYIDEHWKSRY